MIGHSELHVLARNHVAELAGRGVVFDKKQLRYNEIVQVGIHYSNCGFEPSQSIAEQGVIEAIEACIPNSAMYIKGGSVLTMINKWMEGHQSP